MMIVRLKKQDSDLTQLIPGGPGSIVLSHFPHRLNAL